jgi:UDP-N-acetylglucosamine/UDP-N-acetylgalactosamine 4-epimerase
LYPKPFHTTDISRLNFLVTGGAGFIGSHIAEYLLRFGAGKVRVMDNFATGKKENIEFLSGFKGFEFFEGDIREVQDCEKGIEGCNFVFHQAALGSVPRSINDPLNTHQTNATGFLNMLNACRKGKVKRMIYASSSSVYGDIETSPKKEDLIGNPLSPYAVSKRINELYAEVFFKTYGMEVLGLRYFNIFGPRQNPDGEYAAAIPLFIKGHLKQEAVFINGSGEQSRDFTFVENAVQANIKACFSDNPQIPGKVFNVAAGKNVSVNELFEKIKKITGSGLKPVHREERKGDVKNSLADLSKSASLLGYAPEVFIDQGLEATVSYFREKFAS